MMKSLYSHLSLNIFVIKVVLSLKRLEGFQAKPSGVTLIEVSFKSKII